MKIVEHTSDTFIIRDCQGRILFAGLCVIAIAGTTLAGFTDSVTASGNKINEYSSIIVLLFSLIGLAIGGCILYDQRLIYSKFDKELNTAFIYKIGILKYETKSYRLDEIEDIIIAESKSQEDNHFYRVVLKLKDNRKIPISGSRWLNEINLRETSDSIREFLNTKAWQFSHSRIYELMRVSCKSRAMHCY